MIILQPASIASIIIIQLLSVLLEMDSLVSYACTYNMVTLTHSLLLFLSLLFYMYFLPPFLPFFLQLHSFSFLFTVFILFLPVLFTLGWMPQCDTFLINLLEHIDIHIFGGTGDSFMSRDCHVMQSLSPLSLFPPLSPLLSLIASTGLVCSAYAMVRNIFAVLCLFPLGYAAFVSLENV